MDDGNVFKSYVAWYVVKIFEISRGNRDQKVSQATVEVYIIQSSRERYFKILLN